jgi:hypothetical protein
MMHPDHRRDAPGFSDIGMAAFFGAAARIHVPVHRWRGWHRTSAALLAMTIGWGAVMPFTPRDRTQTGDPSAGGVPPIEASEAARLSAAIAQELARITSIEQSEASRSTVTAGASLSDGDLVNLLGGLAADAALNIERFKPVGGSDYVVTSAASTATGSETTRGAPVRDEDTGRGAGHAEPVGRGGHGGHAGNAEEEDWVQRNVAITASGSYSGVADWVGRLGSADRPIGIDNLRIEPERAGHRVRVSADLNILGLRTVMASHDPLPRVGATSTEQVVSFADPFASDMLVAPRIAGRMSGAGRMVEVAVHARLVAEANPMTEAAEMAEAKLLPARMTQPAVEMKQSGEEITRPAAEMKRPAAEITRPAAEVTQSAAEMTQSAQEVSEKKRRPRAGLEEEAKQAEHLDEDRRGEATDGGRPDGGLPAGSTASEAQTS